MGELERMHRTPPTTTSSPSPKTPVSPTIEQLLRSSSRWSPTTSPTLGKDHDMEEDHSPQNNNKKSVLAKVKERAKKWRNTLAKKKQNQDNTTTPSWGVSLDEDEDEEEDPEYLGAPIYESELAPEEYKETARQHPRAFPVISEKRVLPRTVEHVAQQDRDQGYIKPPGPSIDKHIAAEQDKPNPPSKSITETVTKKLAPAYARVSDTAQAISSKIQGLTLSVLAAPATNEHTGAAGGSEHASAGEQIWDKGVSVKEYLMNKLEPGEDERALSQVISEAISPKKTPRDVSVVDKVREVVASLLRNQESSTSKIVHSATNSSSEIPISSTSKTVNSATNSSSQIPVSSTSKKIPVSSTSKIVNSATNSSSQIPVSPTSKIVNSATNSQIPVSPTSKIVNSATNSSSQIPVSPTSKNVNSATNSSSQIPISPTSKIVNSATNSSSQIPVSPTSKTLNSAKNSSSQIPLSATSKSVNSATNSSSQILVSPTSKTVNSATNSSSHIPISSTSQIGHSATSSSSSIPVSTNAHEDVEEENHGRILQAN